MSFSADCLIGREITERDNQIGSWTIERSSDTKYVIMWLLSDEPRDQIFPQIFPKRDSLGQDCIKVASR